MKKMLEDKEAKIIWSGYNTTKGNDKYIIIFVYNKVVYFVVLDELLSQWIYIKNRHNNNYLQLKLCKQDKEYILNNYQKNIQVLCTLKEYNKMKKNYSKKYDKTFNNGTIGEVAIKHFYNQRYTGHDTTPYYKAGDIRVNNVEIQIKWENAQICNFETVKKQLANV